VILPGAKQQLVLEFRIEAHGFDGGRSRSECRTSLLVAPCDETVDVVASLGLVGEGFDFGIGDNRDAECSGRRRRSGALRRVGRSIRWLVDAAAETVRQTSTDRRYRAERRARGHRGWTE